MVAKTLLLLTLSAAAVYAAPAHADTDTDTRTVGSEHQKRQDYSALLKLYAVLRSAGPVALPLIISIAPPPQAYLYLPLILRCCSHWVP